MNLSDKRLKLGFVDPSPGLFHNSTITEKRLKSKEGSLLNLKPCWRIGRCLQLCFDLLCPVQMGLCVFWGLHSLGSWECLCLWGDLNPCPPWIICVNGSYWKTTLLLGEFFFFSFLTALLRVQPCTQRILFPQIYMFQIFVNHNVSSLVSDMLKSYIFFL